MNHYRTVSDLAIECPALRVEIRPLLRLVYLWLGFGLLVTVLISAMTAAKDTLQQLLTNNLVFYGALIVELVLVSVLSTRIHRMSFGGAALTFIVYAAINGFTPGIVFLVFDIGRPIFAFEHNIGLRIQIAVC